MTAAQGCCPSLNAPTAALPVQYLLAPRQELGGRLRSRLQDEVGDNTCQGPLGYLASRGGPAIAQKMRLKDFSVFFLLFNLFFKTMELKMGPMWTRNQLQWHLTHLKFPRGQ